MNDDYVRIQSWHIVGPIVSRGLMVKTLCGRWVKTVGTVATAAGPVRPMAATLPAGEKSCEVCLRAAKRRDDSR
jgi:hypothetical protein